MKTIRILIFLMLIFSLLNCNDIADKKLIGFMVVNFKEARYAIDRDNFVKRASELGAEVLVTNADNDEKKQIEQARELIKSGVDAIVVIAVNQITAAAIAREATKNNIKIIAYERLIQNCPLDFYITYDHTIAGVQMAEYALSQKPTGSYVIISGDKTDKNAELIQKGNFDILNPFIQSNKVKLVFNTYIEDWSSDLAYLTMRKILNYYCDPIDVIIVANDGMAGGVIKSLREKDLVGKILVTGMDAELSACQRIIEGSQSITIYKPMKIQAITAAEITIDLLKGKKIDKEITSVFNGRVHVPTIMLKPMVVDKNNLKQTIIADGFHTEKDIFSEFQH